MRSFIQFTVLGLVAILIAARGASADDALFTVFTADGKAVAITESLLQSLPSQSYDAFSPSESSVRYKVRGPLIRDILKAVGVEAGPIVARGLDGYEADIPAADYLDYAVIAALEVDGKRLGTRDRGPVWIFYPSVDHKEFVDSLYAGRSVWQLKELRIK